MKAVVMAGGFGTRIQPLTDARPKPMLPIMNIPMMQHTMLALKARGITEFIVLLFYKPEIIKEHFGDGSSLGMNITYILPDDDYGTAGAVKLAQEHLKDDSFIIISGDLVTDFNFDAIFEFHQQKNAKLSITLTPVDNPLQFGVVITNHEDKIEKFLEKPSWGEVFSDTINTGIYIIEPEILDYIPEGKNYDFSKDLFPTLMRHGIDLYGCMQEGYWRDVGNPESYREVHEDILKGRVNVTMPATVTPFPEGELFTNDALTLPKGVEIIGKVILGEGVSIGENSKLKDCVIGDNTTIGANSTIRNSVIWDACTLGKKAQLDNSVICDHNSIKKGFSAKAGVIMARGCDIGQLVSIEQDVTIWPEKVIDDAAVISHSVVWGNRFKNSIFENGSVIGRTNIELSVEMAGKLAEAYASQLPEGSTIFVSRDHMRSSKMLKRAFLGGILSAGINVEDLRGMPTAVIRHSVATSEHIAGGVHISQYMNDPTSTIITIYNEDGLRITNNMAKNVERAFFRETFRRVDFTQIGEIIEHARAVECHAYKEAFKNAIMKNGLNCSSCRIAVDMLHGIPSEVFPELLNELSIDNILLNAYHDEQKLLQINTLMKRSSDDISTIVKSMQMDAGFLIYPNGQQLGIVCNNGNSWEKERALLVVLYLLNLEGTPKKVFLPAWAPDVMDSAFNNLTIERGKYSSFSKAELEQYDLIATVDGNFAFTEFSLHRDSMYASMKIVDLIVRHNVTLTEAVQQIAPFYYHSSKVACSQAQKGLMMRKFLEASKGKRSAQHDGVKIWEDTNDWILMIPDQYTNHINLFIQAANQTSGEALLARYNEKIESWLA